MFHSFDKKACMWLLFIALTMTMRTECGCRECRTLHLGLTCAVCVSALPRGMGVTCPMGEFLLNTI